MAEGKAVPAGPSGEVVPGKAGMGILALVVPAVVAVAFMAVWLTFYQGVQGSVASVGTFLPVGYALSAGMVASVNPCGFFMLPSYLSYYLGTETEAFRTMGVRSRVLRALVLSVGVTLGFILVFGSLGALIASGGRWIIGLFPYGGLIVGVALLALGIWVLTGHSVGIWAASRLSAPKGRSPFSGVLFGVAYAVCSLSCTLPVFLVVVGTSLATRGFVPSLGQFAAYSLGMGAVITGVTFGAALFGGATARGLRAALPYVHRASAVFLIGAGAYIMFYWLRYGELLPGR
ncbi:MAG: cytochrome c biogenesis protein CcdA [Chloroflexi bacterium]|nr:cytochrome c biogenesis protein CcdA [Chloroflexota bacterium]